MKVYNKLVRDNIPKMIEMEGRKFTIHIADDNEYYEKLKSKMIEEMQEFLESEKNEELADILEIIHSICEYKGIEFKSLENERLKKQAARGGFERRIILEKVE